MKKQFCFSLLVLLINASSLYSYNSVVQNITIGREFTAVGFPLITTTKILSYIQKERGGEITQHEKNPKKYVLKDGEGKKWGAEIDGQLTNGRVVYEVQSPPVDANNDALMLLPLKALLASGAEPLYSVGGGHMHIDVARYFELHPYQFASLVNFLLNYEETLNYVFSNPRRLHTIRKLSDLRITDGKTTLAQFLGQKLNQYIDLKDVGCENEEGIKKYITLNNKSCLVATLEHFARDVVPGREMDINLQAWKGSSAKKTHGTLELRLFNSPKLEDEVLLEEQLMRSIAELAVNGETNPIRYNPVVDPIIGENAYTDSDKLNSDLSSMLEMLKLEQEGFFEIYIKRLGERRHPSK